MGLKDLLLDEDGIPKMWTVACVSVTLSLVMNVGVFSFVERLC
jgi:hypothetical protein